MGMDINSVTVGHIVSGVKIVSISISRQAKEDEDPRSNIYRY